MIVVLDFCSIRGEDEDDDNDIVVSVSVSESDEDDKKGSLNDGNDDAVCVRLMMVNPFQHCKMSTYSSKLERTTGMM